MTMASAGSTWCLTAGGEEERRDAFAPGHRAMEAIAAATKLRANDAFLTHPEGMRARRGLHGRGARQRRGLRTQVGQERRDRDHPAPGRRGRGAPLRSPHRRAGGDRRSARGSPGNEARHARARQGRVDDEAAAQEKRFAVADKGARRFVGRAGLEGALADGRRGQLRRLAKALATEKAKPTPAAHGQARRGDRERAAHRSTRKGLRVLGTLTRRAVDRQAPR